MFDLGFNFLMYLFITAALVNSFFLLSNSAMAVNKIAVEGAKANKWSDCILIAEQKENRVAIVDLKEQRIVWEWRPSALLKAEHAKWFSNMSDAKLVYNGDYILTTASGGGVALVRIADKKTVFYTYVGGNTHSAELLPDGNIVSASSTGNFLTVVKVDTSVAPDQAYRKNVSIDFGHNVVWDRKNQLLWSAGRSHLNSYVYNFDCRKPDLILKDSYLLPGKESHELFPVYGDNSLWLSNTTHVYRFKVKTRKLEPAPDILLQEHVKSISSAKEAKPTIIIKPKESWWTDEILDAAGNPVFKMDGLRIYKARWMADVPFSYRSKNMFTLCN